MLGIVHLECPVQHYHWGSDSAFNRLLGRQLHSRPEAESWMGAHPKAPSIACLGPRRVPLDRLIADDPIATLGHDVLGVHGPSLPFLFKVLALGEPVSVQTHPSKECAAYGFKAEESKAIPLGDPHRSYRDRGHKPEIIVALEPMVILSGIRQFSEIRTAVRRSGIAELTALVDMEDLSNVIPQLLRFALNIGSTAGVRLHEQLVAAAPHMDQGAVLEQLAHYYPGDPAVVMAVLLNLVHLRPGQALYTPPGQVHALVSGAGIELMANSDNVLRAGLTSKPVHLEEFLTVSILRPGSPVLVVPTMKSPAECVYSAPVEEFQLSIIDLEVGGTFLSRQGPEILLLLGDSAHLRWSEGDLILRRGGVAFVPAVVKEYEARGAGKLYRACMPDRSP